MAKKKKAMTKKPSRKTGTTKPQQRALWDYLDKGLNNKRSTSKGTTTMGQHDNYNSYTGWSPSTGGGSKSTGGHYVGGCSHLGKIEVFRHDGRALYAGGSAMIVTPDVAAVIDLAGTASTKVEDLDQHGRARAFVSNATASSVRDRIFELLGQAKVPTAKPVYIRLDWPDGSAPKVGLAFWRALWASLPQGTDDDPAKIQVCCVGGHGRTGTCLAAFLIAVVGRSRANAVNFVRYAHCTNAVETESQITYLLELAVAAGTRDTDPLDHDLVDRLNGVVNGKKAGTTTRTATPDSPNLIHAASTPTTPATPSTAPAGVPLSTDAQEQLKGRLQSRIAQGPQPVSAELVTRATKVLIRHNGVPLWVDAQLWAAGSFDQELMANDGGVASTMRPTVFGVALPPGTARV